MGRGKTSTQAIHFAEVFCRRQSTDAAFGALVTAQDDSNRAANTAIALERGSSPTANG
jgi:hypothetical protein